MKEKITKIEEIKKNIVKSITCDGCGKKEELEDEYDITDITGIKIGFGYGSKFDTSLWHIDLCDNCIVEFISTLKYPPKGFLQNYIPHDILDTKSLDVQLQIFEEWKNTKDIDWLNWVTKEEAMSKLGQFNEEYKRVIIKKFS